MNLLTRIGEIRVRRRTVYAVLVAAMALTVVTYWRS